MPSVLAYHRPSSLDEASTLLAGPNRRVLAGGTVAVPAARAVGDTGVELVDLQAIGLDQIDVIDNRVRLGAMVRLADVADDERVPRLVRDLARRELPSTLRNLATVGGTVAEGDASSVLIAGLLVHDAQVELRTSDAVSLAQALDEGIGAQIVTAVTIAADGDGVIEAVGRTPADEPIVAAVALSAGGRVRLALLGVAPRVVEVDPGQPTAGLAPAADFRGSSEYRLHLAAIVAARALGGLA